MVKISMTELAAQVEEHSFCKTGDGTEMTSGSLITTRFSNAERFWRYFVVPFTERIAIDPKLVGLLPGFIKPREGIADRILKINEIHYSIFLHLVACHKLLVSKAFLAFTDFFVHLSTAHDLAREFLETVVDYFKNCGDVSTGGHKEREEAVYKFYGSSPIYGDFLVFGRLIDNYRNRIVHRPMIGMIITGHTDHPKILIPRKEYVKKHFDSFQKVFKAAAAMDQNRDKFIELDLEMNGDLNLLEDKLDELWVKVIEELKTLLFVQNNPRILSDFGLENTD